MHIYNRISLLVWLLMVFLTTKNYAQSISVGPGGDYGTLEEAEPHISAGDSVILSTHIFENGAQFLEDLNGTFNAPIHILADSTHGAVFRGGTEAIHLINCSYLILEGLVIEEQTGNGINIDDGGDYSTPTHHITIRNCIFRDMNAGGNNDLLKLSGLDSFLVEDCVFENGGAGGSGIDMVGCHFGLIQDNLFDNAGSSGIQAKGGTQHILIRRNILKDMGQRALNLGGSTGLQYFRPPLPDTIENTFEAADLEVYSNIFIGSWAPIAYVGYIRVKVLNNTIYYPENWVIRILQETTEPGFLPCSRNEFRNNIVYLEQNLTEVNIGPNTEPDSFIFTNNLWFNEDDDTWLPILPVIDSNQIIEDPQFYDAENGDFRIQGTSPCIGTGIFQSNVETDFQQNYFQTPPSIGAFEGDSIVFQSAYEIDFYSIRANYNPSANKVVISGILSDVIVKISSRSFETLEEFITPTSPFVLELDAIPLESFYLTIKSQSYPDLEIRRFIKRK